MAWRFPPRSRRPPSTPKPVVPTCFLKPPKTLAIYRSINALAESVIGLYKAECVRRDGPIRTVEDLELVTSSWVHWFNTYRLHSMIGNVPPVEYEHSYYAAQPAREDPISEEPGLH